MARVLPFAKRGGQSGQLAAEASASAPRRTRIGDLLVHSGALEREALDAALIDQKEQDQKLGNILIANRYIDAEDLAAALSRQSGLGRVDLALAPPDTALLQACDPYTCLALEALPWRQMGGTLVIALADPDKAEAVLDAFADHDPKAPRLALALAPREEIRRAITSAFGRRMRDDARERCPDAFSCRGWAPERRSWRPIALGLAFGTFLALAPLLVLQILMGWIVLASAATTGLRGVALFARFHRRRETGSYPNSNAPRLADHRKLPRVSVLVPLLREEAIAEHLLKALGAMDYPAALLDIKLVLEEDDAVTRAALAGIELPPGIEVVTVPFDKLKTKPKAMNYALSLCEGEIVGVYDAEDRPDARQIRAVVNHLRAAPPEVACVQGYLDFYNSRHNWLSRCFTLEYAMWFRVILQGVQRLGIPIPLGGTTVFFRRKVLEEIGAWDAHNVTEDADLGMRLARFGYRCEMVATTTLEEANCHAAAWIRQRSRWLKGYAMTWASHMRRPRSLYRDLGARGFFGFQVLFLGGLTAYLAIPLFFALMLATYGFGLPFWETLNRPLMIAFTGSMLAGQAVMLAVAAVAARDSGRVAALIWVPTLPAYWLLGAIAAYRAVIEIFTRPFHWHKTAHGVALTRPI